MTYTLVVLDTTTKKKGERKRAVYCSPPLYADELSICPIILGCRIFDSLVHSLNFTSPTSLGISHVVAVLGLHFWSRGFLSVRSGCIVS